ncbi:hypothetical protein [Anaeromicropila herbilytica]|uniref:Uncharacterized protein n=1 Tax=Anaeromicropila herbilytica TaxID=2785025 RepID=A0A7R7IDB7_9FIRM|nr:hypothetical protein [Anaeromicropila herbilytica]BCN30771.1 hypothetical protein bsdtb5_20660 [Anaeromicropila herbilytica]
MKLKLNNWVRVTVLLSFLALLLIIKPNTIKAAQSESKPNGITELKANTKYEYDLNGDGKTEEVLYKLTTNDDKYTVTLKLYINDKLCLTRTSHGFDYTINICDLNKDDNYLDLYGSARMESDCISDSFFTQYNGEKLINLIKFQPEKIYKKFNAARYSLGKIDGNGKFTLVTDTPIYSNAIGCYYCNVPYQIKDNKISKISANTYTLAKFSKDYTYKAKKSFSVYSTVGGKKVVYTVKKNDKVTFDQIYVTKAGKVYCRIINNKGIKGWIKSDQEGLFMNTPAWG